MKSKMFAMAALALTLAVSVNAQGKGGKDKSGPTVGDKVREVLPASQAVFTREEITLVKTYFRDNKSGLPPGLAKREKLPPGLEKQLQRNGTLPPGLQKKLQPMPSELERRMRTLPTGWRRVVIAGCVIMMNEKTSKIYDVVRDVIR